MFKMSNNLWYFNPLIKSYLLFFNTIIFNIVNCLYESFLNVIQVFQVARNFLYYKTHSSVTWAHSHLLLTLCPTPSHSFGNPCEMSARMINQGWWLTVPLARSPVQSPALPLLTTTSHFAILSLLGLYQLTYSLQIPYKH